MCDVTTDRDKEFGFASAHDAPIPYLQRIRSYYVGLGYGAPYEWAHYLDVPFQALRKPLSNSRVALITTAARFQPDKGDQGPGAPYNAAAKFYAVYSGDTAKDIGTYFPLAELRRNVAARRIGSVVPRFHGMPTNRSHRATLDVDCPEVVARCKADEVDAAILVPNCPVCHQTMSLAARMLEENGIATVVMGCAKDIVEYVGVPRLLFSDFPLGNAAGRPKDPASQAFTLDLALRLLQTAPAARTTVQSPLRWSTSPDWKLDYCNIERLSPEEIARRRAEFDKGKAEAKRVREATGIVRPTAEDPIG